MNRILAASAIAIASLSVACGSKSDSTQADQLVELNVKVPADQAQQAISSFYEAPRGGAACYPRTCSVGAPDADGNVEVYASMNCDTAPSHGGVCTPDLPDSCAP